VNGDLPPIATGPRAEKGRRLKPRHGGGFARRDVNSEASGNETRLNGLKRPSREGMIRVPKRLPSSGRFTVLNCYGLRCS